MNIAESSINKKLITIVLTIVFLFAGIKSYNNLARLEDPEFTIKEAIISTPYPGASAAEVEEEVSNVIEKACQELGQLLRIESVSTRNMSTVKVVMKDQYDKTKLPQVWDELRRKVTNAQTELPPKAGPSLVNDDFGDVYGVFFAVSGEGYTYAELKDFVEFLKKELLLVEGVKKIALYGVKTEAVYIEMNREKMAALGISPQNIYDSLKIKNIPINAGRINIGDEFVPINPTGEFTSEQQFGDLLISSNNPDRIIYLKDVASIKRDYKEPSSQIMRFNGKPAIGMAFSTVEGGNVVTMGEGIEKRLRELKPQIPVGMELGVIALQSQSVIEAINGFIVNLIEAILIVFVVLMIFMGLRSGLIIGFILLLTICASFVFMGIQDIVLQRISLGALIIALGMLVDNAIVITEGMQISMEKGEDPLKAAKQTVGQSMWPLFGATLIAVIAFAAIGTSSDSTGEYCRSLFQVILISLMLSWVTAITVTPLLCKFLLKRNTNSNTSAQPSDPYGGFLFKLYKKSLISVIRFRWFSVIVIIGIFFASLYGFKFVKNMFFPAATRAQYYVQFRYPEGTHIDKTLEKLKVAEEYLMSLDSTVDITTTAGGGDIRFLLTYSPESASSSFGQILVSTTNYNVIQEIGSKVQSDLEKLMPDAIVNFRTIALGPSTGGKIQLRISGTDYNELRELADTALRIINEEPDSKATYYDWYNRVKTIRPELLESQARRVGITRENLAEALAYGFIGKQIGVYRENDLLIPIIARAPEQERVNVDNLYNLQIWSPVSNSMIPLRQIADEFPVVFENPVIARRNRMPTITIHCDPRKGLPSELFEKIKPKIEKKLNVDVSAVLNKRFAPGTDPFDNFDSTTLPVKYNTPMPLKGKPGFAIAWGGEAEDSVKAQSYIAKSLPAFGLLMVLIMIFLFNSLRKPLVICLCVPLALIGVTVGLLTFRQPFGFMALLGLLSLAGMLIKNAIVLIDQIDAELKEGQKPFNAIINSGVSRMRPVSMAALTTILGMMPLLTDGFFVSMAVTIMFGLGFATVLTLYVVPLLYSIIFKVKAE